MRQGGAALRLATRRERRHPSIGRLAAWHELLEARRRPCSKAPPAATRALPAAALTAHAGGLDVVGERDRRAVRRAGQRLGRLDRDGRPAASRGGDLARLERDRAVAAGPAVGHEPVMEVLHRRLRVERQHRVLELVGAELGHDVRRHEDERVARPRPRRARRPAPARRTGGRVRGAGRGASRGGPGGSGRPRPARPSPRTSRCRGPRPRPPRSGRWRRTTSGPAGRPGGRAACWRSPIAFWMQTRIPADSS